MAVKALLVNPRFPDTFWGFRHSLPFLGKKATYPPLGLITVAALLPGDWEKRVIDMNVERLEDEDLEWADLVLFTAMIVQRTSLAEALRRAKAKGKPTVLGGPFASSTEKRPSNVDHLIRGEAEISLSAFVDDWMAGKAAPEYRELGPKPDLSLSPIPRFDLLRMDAYSSMSMQFSRGCPFNCDFCDITQLYGRLPRTKTPERALEELSALLKLGYRGPVFIVDDNFIGNARLAGEFLERLGSWQEKRGRPLSFHTEASVNLADHPALLKLMAEAGFTMAFLGIETPDKASLAASGKIQNLNADPLESVKRIQSAGIEVSAGFIIGFDEDPPDIAERQIEFIRRSGIPTAMVGLLTALPGTRLAARLRAEGRMREASTGDNTFAQGLNFAPTKDEAGIVAAYERVIEEIYRPSSYFKRCADLLKAYPKDRPPASGRPRIAKALPYAVALFASVFRQGFSGYGAEYFNFLALVAARRPALFPRAIKMAILGHHFFSMRKKKVVKRVRRVSAFMKALDWAAKAVEGAESAWRSEGAVKTAKKAVILWHRIASRILTRYAELDRGLALRVKEAFEDLESRIRSSMRGIGKSIRTGYSEAESDARSEMKWDLRAIKRSIRPAPIASALDAAAVSVMERLRSVFVTALDPVGDDDADSIGV